MDYQALQVSMYMIHYNIHLNKPFSNGKADTVACGVSSSLTSSKSHFVCEVQLSPGQQPPVCSEWPKHEEGKEF